MPNSEFGPVVLENLDPVDDPGTTRWRLPHACLVLPVQAVQTYVRGAASAAPGIAITNEPLNPLPCVHLTRVNVAVRIVGSPRTRVARVDIRTFRVVNGVLSIGAEVADISTALGVCDQDSTVAVAVFDAAVVLQEPGILGTTPAIEEIALAIELQHGGGRYTAADLPDTPVIW